MRPDDVYFIELLHREPTFGNVDPQHAIPMGTALCWRIEHGTARGRAALDLQQDAKMTYDAAITFTSDAISAYCPHAGLDG
jgi:hypothetical protein